VLNSDSRFERERAQWWCITCRKNFLRLALRAREGSGVEKKKMALRLAFQTREEPGGDRGVVGAEKAPPSHVLSEGGVSVV
jgi:hypothetical protein